MRSSGRCAFLSTGAGDCKSMSRVAPSRATGQIVIAFPPDGKACASLQLNRVPVGTSRSRPPTVGAMRTADIQALFDFTYWADRQILNAAAALPVTDFTQPTTITYRNLRGTLVHTFDVEMSWRRRLRGEPKEVWDARSTSTTTRPPRPSPSTGRATRQRCAPGWHRSGDDDLAAIQDLGNADRFPLWYYLVHVVTHSEQQRRDAQIILAHLGHEPPDLEFLYYADSLVEAALPHARSDSPRRPPSRRRSARAPGHRACRRRPSRPRASPARRPRTRRAPTARPCSPPSRTPAPRASTAPTARPAAAARSPQYATPSSRGGSRRPTTRHCRRGSVRSRRRRSGMAARGGCQRRRDTRDHARTTTSRPAGRPARSDKPPPGR